MNKSAECFREFSMFAKIGLLIVETRPQGYHEYLREVDEKEWNNEYFLHPTLGRVTLEKCISMYANHIPYHIEHIERNKKLLAEPGLISGVRCLLLRRMH
jgi:hypothetical protein